jgi:alkanesulfonate monooxygenase SsuD/methylene tetrahydromethanopterin reductase-like flavin-dependent oxidoreductase (luciferase family)
VSSPAVGAGCGGGADPKRIRLTSAVSVLGSDDPVRVFQQFATVDLLSGGRAEIMAGRGSFIESFPLFGYDLADYDELFAEHLQLLLALREHERVTWRGRHRAAIEDRGVYPRPLQQPLPVWIAVGGTPQSAGPPAAGPAPGPRHHRRHARAVRAPSPSCTARPPAPPGTSRRPSASTPTATSPTTRSAPADEAFGPFAATMDRIGRERGWPPFTRQQFEASRALRGANFVGSPQQVIDKILFQHGIFGHQRCLLQFTVGPMPHRDVMRSIELFGTEVAPVVRRETATRN